MAGLLEKDVRLIFKRKQTIVIFIALAFMIGLNTGGSFIIGYLSCLCAIFTISTISYDEMENGFPFLMTLPIDRKTYVYEKYVFCFGVGMGSWGVAVLLSLAVSAVKGVGIDFAEELMGALAMIPMFMLFGAVMIPLQLKFGAEKSRIVMALLTGGIIAAGFTMKNVAERTGVDVGEKIARLDEMPYGVVFGCLMAGVGVIVALSVWGSVRILEKKEY